MGLTALQQNGEGLGTGWARYATGEYRGAVSAARFCDPQAEFAALRDSCAVYDLGFRAKISLTGSDRVRWLNGMVTNNIRDLQAGHGVYAFLLNPQGHILGDLYAYNRGESIMVDTDSAQIEKITATFDHYIIMDDVEVANISEQMTTLGVGGPTMLDVMRNAGLEIPDLQPLEFREMQCNCECGCVNCTVVRTDESIDAYEIWLAPGHVRPLWNTLVAAGASPIGFETLEMHRLVLGIPRFGVDIRERDLPQETEQARALNFNKGCYIGQEIVERIRSRGAVHRKFSGFLVTGGKTIPAGTKIVAGEKEIGEITSAAQIFTGGSDRIVALGYVRRELWTPGREVLVGGINAQVIQLPVPRDMLSHDTSFARHSA